MITRLRLGFSHLQEHKFKHNFIDTLNPLCSCNIEVESTTFWVAISLMLCRLHLWTILRNIDSDLPTLKDENLTNILLYGNQIYDDQTNQIILMHVMQYIKDSQRFDEPLFKLSKNYCWLLTDLLVFLFLRHIRCKVFFIMCLIFTRKDCKHYLCIHIYGFFFSVSLIWSPYIR